MITDLSLDTVLEEVWNQRVVPLYKDGKIQTERHLQAYLFMWLKEWLGEESIWGWDVWIEPQFYFKEKDAKSGYKMYKPDIVVTKGTEIAGFIELKFSPQEQNIEKNLQSAKRDIDKLVKYHFERSVLPRMDEVIEKRILTKQNGDYFLLEINPQEGSYRQPPIYKRTPNTLYGFLGIAKYGKEPGEFAVHKYILKILSNAKYILKLLDN